MLYFKGALYFHPGRGSQRSEDRNIRKVMDKGKISDLFSISMPNHPGKRHEMLQKAPERPSGACGTISSKQTRWK